MNTVGGVGSTTVGGDTIGAVETTTVGRVYIVVTIKGIHFIVSF